MNLHGGRVWAEDRPDGQPGGRFVIELPLVPEDAEEEHGDDGIPLDEVPSEDAPTLDESEEFA